MSGLTSPRNRKWARRGAAVADFIVGFFVAALGHVFVALFHAVCGAVVFFRSVRARPRELGRRDEASSRKPPSPVVYAQELPPGSESRSRVEAVEALVVLGIPRRAAGKRVDAALAKHGPLPLEQLLPKTLSLRPR